MEKSSFVHVAVGVIRRENGDILIAQRPEHLHQGGLWEFSGGKVEENETVEQALTRELHEELAIRVESCESLIQIRHHYADKSVLLDVWTIESFSGIPDGREGQPIRWVAANELQNYAFPAANHAIIYAAQLPSCYAILDDEQPQELMENLQKLLVQNIKLIQARLKNLSALAVESFLQHALPLCEKHHAHLLLNSAVKTNFSCEKRGLHLTSDDLMQLSERPKLNNWLAASCHTLAQLQHAEKIGVDFAVLSPVLPTQTHPTAAPLGWETFAEWVTHVNIPVYALGGLQKTDKMFAKKCGAQGIAGIRTFL